MFPKQKLLIIRPAHGYFTGSRDMNIFIFTGTLEGITGHANTLIKLIFELIATNTDNVLQNSQVIYHVNVWTQPPFRLSLLLLAATCAASHSYAGRQLVVAHL